MSDAKANMQETEKKNILYALYQKIIEENLH